MVADDQERTEAATPKRRREAREEGQVARSPEVLTAFVLGAGVLGVWVGAGHLYREMAGLTADVIRLGAGLELTRDTAVTLALRVFRALLSGLAPVFLAALVGGIAGNVAQVGFLVSFKAITPNPDRLNPFTGFKNLFQWSKVVDLGKNLLKVVAVGWAAYLALKGHLWEFPSLAGLPPNTLLEFLLLRVAFPILKNVLLVYVAIAILDYAFQRWEFEKKIRMTKQEIKDEYKETEGDPLIRSRIRSLQREMARRRMMAEVPRSDVVITNPTHFAVALRYVPGEMDAPEVTAKGADKVAEKILEVAREHGVPVVEDPPVARALYRQTEPGDRIPVDLFQAVAEILAHVYRLTGKLPGGEGRPGG
ncbi:flagellar biosynthesis protein FlhB [Deferrisoma palaeochoriense]